MWLMDRMREGFLIQFGITPRILRLQYLSQVSRDTRLSSSTRQTIPLPTYSSFCERVLRSSPETADSFLPAITRTKSLSPSIQDVRSLISHSKEEKSKKSQHAFSNVLTQYLEQERIESDKKVVAELINKHFPDWRRVLNELQRYSVGGKIDSGILAYFSDVKVNDLIKNLKEKNFPEVRKWIVSNLDNDSSVLLRRIYDSLNESLVPASIPAAVLVIAKYQYQVAFVADQEINMLACLTEIMVECKFK